MKLMFKYFSILAIFLIYGCGENEEYQSGLERYERAVVVMEENMKLLEADLHNEAAAKAYNIAKDSMEVAAKEINALAAKKITISKSQGNTADELNLRVKTLNDKLSKLNRLLDEEEAERILKEKQKDDEPVLHSEEEHK